ncbi:PstS family phosphate ABC transporter substrate-binding protein [Salisediminibacterium beveridgei]|nr:substrate-binding domain-containing protein [Salisediminibacterium beveridgei]
MQWLKAAGVLVGVLLIGFFTMAFSFFVFMYQGPGFQVGLAVSGGVILSGLLIYHAFTKAKGRRRVIVTAAVVGVFAIVLISHLVYENIQADRIIAERGVDLADYEPHAGSNGLARLDGNATFTYDEADELPELDGATALYPVYAAFVEAVYPEGDYPPFLADESQVVSTKTGDAYSRLFQGQTDMIFAAGPSDRQVAEAERLDVDLVKIPIGQEAFVFFVHEDHPVEALTIEEIQDIYAGEITNWSDVGGDDEPIRAFQRPEDSGSQTALENLMEDRTLMSPPEEDVPGGMGQIISETARYENALGAIGFSFRYFSSELVEERGIKHVAVNGVYPDEEGIRSGEYPIASNFYVVTTEDKYDELRPFIDWILSEEGQQLIEDSGYVGVQ